MKTTVRELRDVIGLVAVVASLLVLAYEVRESNRIARSTISYELANNYSELNEVVWTDPDVAYLRANVRDPDYVPTAIETERLIAEIRRLMNVWGAVESAYRNGHQTREQFDVMLAAVGAHLADCPAVHPLWRQELDRHPGLTGYEFYERAREAIAE